MPHRYAWKDAVGIILIIGTVFFLSYTIGANAWWYSKEAIHDDACTLGHSFTMGLDFDLDYMNEVSLGKYANSYRGTPPVPPGIGVLSAPFVAFFSIFDRIAGHPVIQDHAQYFGSWSFFAVGLSSSFYFLMGAYLYYRGLRSLIDISPAFVFILCTGTGILSYVLMRPLMSHAFEFFNYALCFFASVQLYLEGTKKQWLFALLAAIAVTMAWLTRLHAIFPVLFPIITLLGLMLTMQTFDRRTFLTKAKLYMLALVPCFAVAITLMYGIYAGPAPKLDSYGNIYTYVPVYTTFFTFVADTITLVVSRLALLPVILVGNSFPLWCFMPIAMFGVGALLLHGYLSARRSGHRTLWILWTLLSVLYMAGPIAAVLLWRMPGSAYGFRYLYPLVPLGFLGFTLWRLRAGTHSNILSQTIIAVMLVTSLFGTLAPVAFNSNPAWGYTHSPINEFGLKEGISARDNLYRTIAWMEHPSFLRVAIGYGPAFAFLPRTSPEVAGKQAYIHNNTYAQIYIMCAVWAAFSIVFAFRNPHERSLKHTARVSMSAFAPTLAGLIALWHVCFIYYQHRPEVVSTTLEHAASIRDRIESERNEKGTYPVQNDFTPIELGDNNIQFLYKSDGTNYKLIVLNAPDANIVTLFHPEERDPSRPWWAYGYWTKEARKW